MCPPVDLYLGGLIDYYSDSINCSARVLFVCGGPGDAGAGIHSVEVRRGVGNKREVSQLTAQIVCRLSPSPTNLLLNSTLSTFHTCM